ncbi:MAG: imidazole glycerol phosphate synthase subunit HisF [Cyclobacteriaceae bacterium]
MLTKRIIPCLDIKDGRTVKGVNFVDLKDAGDPVALAAKYAADLADELVFLDITATVEKRKTLVALVEKVAAEINIPFTVGGGVSSLADASALLDAGAEKIAVNSAAIKNPGLINELVREFGSQAVVVAIDSQVIDGTDTVHTHGGRTPTEVETIAWTKEMEQRGAGEILLTSMDHDGTKAGFANDLTSRVSSSVNIPVIASGGGGQSEHFVDAFTKGKADAALAASIFHYNEIGIVELKGYLREAGIAMRV